MGSLRDKNDIPFALPRRILSYRLVKDATGEKVTVLMPVGGPVSERDDALMACLAARDATALRTVISLYGEKAHRIAWRMLGDAAEAEDVAQEAMLRLWQQADGWSTGGHGIGPWLARVTTNLCIDRMRRIRPVTGEELPERVDEVRAGPVRAVVERGAVGLAAAGAAL